MKTQAATTTLLAALLYAGATQAESVYVIHGINGNDLGVDQSLPVDLYVNGDCIDGVTSNIPYKGVLGPLDLPTGAYSVEVRLSGSEVCDGGPLAITGGFEVQFAETKTVVAHLTTNGAPTLSQFSEDVRPTKGHYGRLVFNHAAAADPASVKLAMGVNQVTLNDAANGTSSSAVARAETWHATITVKSPFETNTILGSGGYPSIGPIPLTIHPDHTTSVYAVGSLENGTIDLISHTIAH